jgi:selenocysteine-specific elongation factor
MIVASAGHIDHGKTALVRALTGVDTDRLPEEKVRGISIDLGFAYLPLAGGGLIGFVDVPGHERFIHNMLAGVCGIDFALLVVAADDGVMPQTVEHLQILDLLGIKRGIAAITKTDRVDPERVREVEAEVRALLAGTALAGSALLPVSALAASRADTSGSPSTAHSASRAAAAW